MSLSKYSRDTEYISWFKDLTHKDIDIAGGKNVSLGEVDNKFTKCKSTQWVCCINKCLQ